MTALPENLKLLLVGDWCEDVYHFCDQTRTNPEAIAPLVSVDYTLRKMGMAMLVSDCLTNLGLNTWFYSNPPVATKERYIDKASGKQLLRVDDDYKENNALGLSLINFNRYDAIVISDYNKGTILDATIKDIMAGFTGPIFLDTKKTNLNDYAQQCIIKINEHESRAAGGAPPNAYVTLGGRGAIKAYTNESWPAMNVDVKDTCGAGDAFLAGLVYGYFADRDNAAEYGIVNAGISVQHLGTYAPTLEELLKGKQEYDAQRRQS